MANPYSSATSQLNSEATEAQISEQFLKVRLNPKDPVLLPIQQITEVLNIPEEQIMPIPHMPAWVMGVYNWRGEILWMVDLGHLCGLAPWYQHSVSRSTRSTVILNQTHPRSAKEIFLGLFVSQIEDIQICHADQIQPAADLEIPTLKTLARGCWLQADTALAILDGTAILANIQQFH